MIKKIVAFIALAVYMQTALYAQENQNRTLINAALHGWEYEIRAGVSIGGQGDYINYLAVIPPVVPGADFSFCHLVTS